MFALRPILLALMAVLMAGCATRPPPIQTIDCRQADTRCHEGRFGLTYRLQREGVTEEDAVNGTWRWESRLQITDTDMRVRPAAARLELSSVLGTRIATVEQARGFILLTDSKGRQYQARDWDDLFSRLFELKLPGEAIAGWMAAGASPMQPPPVEDAGWTVLPAARRLRMMWQGTNGQIRVDLIPDASQP